MKGMGDRSTHSKRLHRRKPAAGLLLASLVLVLVGCSPRRSQPNPVTVPAKPPSTAPSEQTAPPANAAVQGALAAATDLFNRGENDLACEQVAKAEQQQRSATTAPPAELQRYRQACQTP
jgi:hypothetical protein